MAFLLAIATLILSGTAVWAIWQTRSIHCKEQKARFRSKD